MTLRRVPGGMTFETPEMAEMRGMILDCLTNS